LNGNGHRLYQTDVTDPQQAAALIDVVSEEVKLAE
jgi:hypothetical protein